MAKDTKNFLKDIKFVMNVLGLSEDERVLKILLNSLDSVAFVEELIKKSNKSEKEVLDVLLNSSLKIKALKYKLLKAKWAGKFSLDQSKNKFTEIVVDNKASKFSSYSDKPQKLSQKNIHDEFIMEQFDLALTTPFSYRDDMDEYVGRFLGFIKNKPAIYKKQKINNQELSDLEEDIERLEKFLNKIGLEKLDNFVSNGIGANEMYCQQLAQMVNGLSSKLKLKFKWEVVDNPSDLGKVFANCIDINTENTLAYDQSRSGTTVEPGDFLELTTKKDLLYINKRIIWSNGNRFHELGERLAKADNSASVLHIDNTPGNIGGRHMNLKTGMVCNPLFISLSILGYKLFKNKKKAFVFAREGVKNYANGLFRANKALTPKQENTSKARYNPASILATELLRKRDVEARVKPAFIFDPSLKHFTVEVFQNTNEGIAKPAKGKERNNNMYSFWDTSNKDLDYMSVFKAKPKLYQPLFIINESTQHSSKMLKEARQLVKLGIPVHIVRLKLKKLDAKPKTFYYNLSVQAQATALLQTFVTTFTHLTDQDANSNPAVKMTRTITSAIQDILVDRKKKLGELSQDSRQIKLDDILDKMKKEEKRVLLDADKKIKPIVKKNKSRKIVMSKVFNDFGNDLQKISKKLKVKDEDLAKLFISSVSRDIFIADLGEAGGIKSALVKSAFGCIEFIKVLGSKTKDFGLVSLSKTKNIYKDKDLLISLSLPKGKKVGDKLVNEKNLARCLADYYFDRLREEEKIKTVNTLGIGFAENDWGNKSITSISKAVNDNLARLGINSLDMYFPRVAHTGIEAAQALPEILSIIGLIPYENIKDEYGRAVIRMGLTVNDANKIYILSNVARMALGGSPTVIFEYKDARSLPKIKKIVEKVLVVLGKKLEKVYKK